MKETRYWREGKGEGIRYTGRGRKGSGGEQVEPSQSEKWSDSPSISTHSTFSLLDDGFFFPHLQFHLRYNTMLIPLLLFSYFPFVSDDFINATPKSNSSKPHLIISSRVGFHLLVITHHSSPPRSSVIATAITNTTHDSNAPQSHSLDPNYENHKSLICAT